MIAPTRLSRYLSKTFITSFIGLTLILMAIIFVFEFGELLRRAANQEAATLNIALIMAALKLPYTGEILFPFAILFGAIHTCWKLNRTQELVIMRSAGLSVWQFLGPVVLAAICVGALATGIVNPIASATLSKFRQMETVYFRKNSNLVAVSQTGIWLRQPAEDGYALLHASTLDQKQWRMDNVTVYTFDDRDNFKSRIDSPETWLKDGYWDVKDALVNTRGGTATETGVHIPTELTARKIEDTFADPDMISFWNIPRYVKIMEETGFPSTRLRIHFQSLLAQPLLFAAMVLLAATFSLRPPRFRGTGIMVALGAATGFFVFFMESILGAFGASQKIPVFLAAWTPAVVGTLLGITALLHMEDG